MTERNDNPESGTGANPSFEQSLTELQEIVRVLEEGTLGLEDSMRRFETGVTLLRNCYRILEEAERKIEILTGIDARGNPVLAPFDASATFEQTGQSAGRRRRAPEKKPPSPAPAEEMCAEEDEDGATLF